MKKLTVLVFMILAALQVSAVAPESGKIYKIVNPMRGDLKIAEDIIGHTVYCPQDLGNKVYQYWLLEKSGSTWTIKNVYTGRYLQNHTTTYENYTTGTGVATFTITENTNVGSDYYTITNGSGGRGLHCDAGAALVPWGADTGTSPGGSSWKFELVEISDEEIAAANKEYEDFAAVTENGNAISTAYTAFFNDDICMQLKSEYASMSDDELRSAMNGIPTELVEAALKVKNNSWAEYEKEFRLQTYKAYSDPDTWGTKLITKKFTWQNNPTGIYANTANVLYVFVNSHVPAGASLEIDAVTDNAARGTRTTLTKGLNIIPVSRDQQTIFVIYTANTIEGKPLADFPDIDIRIEGGILNGYWDKERHDDADWVYISQKLATHPYIIVKGKNVIFNAVNEYMTKAGYCDKTITDAINWWDNMAEWHWEIMGLEDYMPNYFNNKLCARTLPTGYQSATNYYTQYLSSYINNLFPYDKMMSNADNCWGPAHENGHVHQGAITPVNCSEVSNNLFSNLTLYKLGKYTSRGGSISEMADEYIQGLPWPSRSASYTLRMYWQLYLYYHMAGNNPQFYPTLFKLLREEPMVKVGGAPTYGNTDLLLFAEKCCEAAGEDLTEFFEAYGFFVPIDNQHYGDYADYYLTSTQEMIDATKAKISQYKRGPAIQFIEDRILGVPRTDGGSGNKIQNPSATKDPGDLGHFTAFTPEKQNTKAEGYVYSKGSTIIEISRSGTGAVGFKVLDAEGKTISFSNKYKISLTAQQLSRDFTVVAVQANGEYVEVPSAALAGTEQEQLEALSNALTAANTCINYTSTNNLQVGYFYPEAIADLKLIYDEAKNAFDFRDKSKHTFGEWAMMLDNAVKKLKNDKYAYVNIKEKNIHTIVNRSFQAYGFSYQGSVLIGASTSEIPRNDERRMWEFESAGASNEFYIKCSNGYYITALAEDEQAAASSKLQSSAVVFVSEYNGDATFSFYLKENPSIYLTMKRDVNGYKVVGDEGGTASANWRLSIAENNAKEYEKTKLENLITEAGRVIDEVGVINGTTLTINENVANAASNLTEIILDINNARTNAQENKETAYDLARYIDELQAAIANADGTYILTPEAKKAGFITWYYIKNNDGDTFCGIDTESTSSTYSTSVSLGDLAKDDKNYWWAFEPTGNENEYKIYNAGQNYYLYTTSRSFLKADGKEAAGVYTVTVDAENGGLLISEGKKYWNNSNKNYSKVTTAKSYWKIMRIGSEETGIEEVLGTDENTENAIYDMYGRKVNEITESGIYIINGKKVLVK